MKIMSHAFTLIQRVHFEKYSLPVFVRILSLAGVPFGIPFVRVKGRRHRYRQVCLGPLSTAIQKINSVLTCDDI